METFKRTERISEVIKRELSEILRDEVNDPRLEFLSITNVEVTPDLRHAMIYVSPIKDEDVGAIEKCLNHARGYIQKMLGRRLKIRYTPVIEFRIDASIKKAAHIMEILENIKKGQSSDNE